MNFSVNGVMFTRIFVNEENKRKGAAKGAPGVIPRAGSPDQASPLPPRTQKMNPPGNPGGLRFFARFYICGFKRFLLNNYGSEIET